jgi:hypothetical protein
MSEKVEKLGVNRDKDFMYYVKDGSVWRVQRKQPGVPKGRPEKVAEGSFQMDTDFIYFVDKDGDVSRAKRAVGGQKRKKTARKPSRRAAPKRPKAKPAKARAAKSAKGAKAKKPAKAAAKSKGKAKASKSGNKGGKKKRR